MDLLYKKIKFKNSKKIEKKKKITEWGKAGRVWGLFHSPRAAMARWSGDGDEEKVMRELVGRRLFYTYHSQIGPSVPFQIVSRLCFSRKSQLSTLQIHRPFSPAHLGTGRFLGLDAVHQSHFLSPLRPISDVSPFCLSHPHCPWRFKHSVLSILLAFCTYLYHGTCPFKF